MKNKDINCYNWVILSLLFHDKIDDHYDTVSNYNKLTNRQIFEKLGSPAHLSPDKSIFNGLTYLVTLD